MDETVAITLRLPVALRERLELIALAQDVPASRVIQQAVEAYVDVESIKGAIAEAETGDFASDDEVDAFFLKWTAGPADAG